MTSDKEIKKWREKLSPYVTAVQTKLYIEQQKREHLRQLQEMNKKMNTEEIKLLQAQNEALKQQNISLQKEVKQWKHEYEMLDACIESEQRKIAELQGKLDAYKMSENEANEIIAELKAYKDVNEDFKTAWEELKAENKKLKKELVPQ